MTVDFISKGGFILGQTAWEEGLPWLRPDATRFLQEHLLAHSKIFEWGMGGSTIWFARQNHHVISIENNHDWFVQVDERIVKENLEYQTAIYCFGNKHELKDYADYILKYRDELFDLVLVDGRNRKRCLCNAIRKVRMGGMLCLDNSERVEYAEGVKLLEYWMGHQWGDEDWMTTIWIKTQELQPECSFVDEEA